MPYIKKENRPYIVDDATENIVTQLVSNPGTLNFAITSLIHIYLRDKGKNYTNINEVIGVLECVKMEFYRRIAAPYENEKIEENGDINYG